MVCVIEVASERPECPVSVAAVVQRQKISDRRQRGLRRRAGRMSARFGVLLGADVAALVAVRALLAWMTVAQWPSVQIPGDFKFAGPLSQPGEPASLVFWLAAPIALALTGSYSRYRTLNTPLRLASACLLAGASATLPLAAVVGTRVALAQLGVVAGAAWVSLLTIRPLAEKFLQNVWPRSVGAAPAIILGSESALDSTAVKAVTAPGGDYRVAVHHKVDIPRSHVTAALARAISELIELHRAEAVVVTDELPERDLDQFVTSALDAGCVVLVPLRAVVVEGIRPRLVWHGDQPFLEFARPGLQVAALVTKRITDLIGAAALLVLVSPLVLLIAIGIRLDSPGPVFFSQNRAGLGGKRFRMWKFRTMRLGADQEKHELAHLNHTGDVRLFKIPHDPRVTKFGSFLRRWSLDEIPQFWNVLRGEMSLVGPRPFFEADFTEYEDHHFRRLDSKPGITGLWQVGGRSDVVNFEDVIYLDHQYIENWSLWLDLSILLRTLPSVIRREGAY